MLPFAGIIRIRYKGTAASSAAISAFAPLAVYDDLAVVVLPDTLVAECGCVKCFQARNKAIVH